MALSALVLATLGLASAAGAGVATQTANVVGQGPGGPVVSADGATLQRSDSGLSAKLHMPTPVPGSYVYPPTGNAFLPAPVPGFPEAYSLWMFVFNYPALCSAPCDSNDLGSDKPAKGGAFNVGGHIVGGPNLVFGGHVSMNTPPLVSSMSPLLEPQTAEVHLAVAPHGEVVPALLPDQITKPIGAPANWWLAFFFAS